MRSLIAAALLLAGCSAVQAAPDASQVKGSYDIWEDFEGGTVCPLTLDDAEAIGGYALEGDDTCMQVFKFAGDPYAWFLDDDSRLVMIDATRQVLARFQPLEDGVFRADRSDEGLEGVVLSPAD